MANPDPRSDAAAPESLVDVALDHLREKIISGALPPGERIKERAVAEETGVSRVPIREALRVLAAEGMITLAPRRGAVVTRLEPNMLDEIFEVREALEVQQSVLAIRKATDDEVADLLAIAERAGAAAAHGARADADAANVEFHDQLLTMAHNAVLARMLEPLQRRLHWLFQQNNDLDLVYREHRAQAEAIAARDTRTAHELGIAHIRTSRILAFRVVFGITVD